MPVLPSLMPHADLIGGLAALVCTLCFIPQVVKTWRSRDTSSISLVMYILLFLGNVLWWLYGLVIWSMPLLIGNSINVLLVGAILVAKLRFG